MEKAERKKLYRKAIDMSGEDPQLGLLAERCIGLADAALKMMRSKELPDVPEHVAYVEIMIEHLQELFKGNWMNGHFREFVESHKEMKLNNLKAAIENAEAERKVVQEYTQEKTQGKNDKQAQEYAESIVAGKPVELSDEQFEEIKEGRKAPEVSESSEK